MQGIPGLDVIEGLPKSKLRTVPPSLKTFEVATRGLQPAATAAPVVPTPMSAVANTLGGGAGYNDAPNRAGYVANQIRINNAAGLPAPSAPEPMPKVGFLRRQMDAAGNFAGKAGEVARAGSRFTTGVATAAAPAIFGSAARSLTNRAVDASAGPEVPGVPDQVAPGQIPGAVPGMVAPAAVRGDVLRDTELGRNVGNTINALGPVAAPLGQIARGAATLAPRAAAAVTGGTAALRGFAAPEIVAAAVQPQAAQTEVTPPSSSTQNSAAAVAAEMAGRRGANRDAAAAMPVVPENNITRSGNSYSGENIRAGATINGGPGRGGVTVVPSGPGPSSGGLFGGQALAEARMAAAARGTPFNADGSLGVSRSFGDGGITLGQNAVGFGGGTLSSALRDKVNSAPAEPPPGLSAQQTAAWRQQNASLAQAREIADAQIANAAAGTAQTGRIAEMNNATLRDTNATTNAARMQGDRLDYAAKMAPIEVQRQQREMYQRITAAATKDGVYDPAIGQQLAASAGIDPKFFKEQVDAAQSQRAAQQGLEKGNAERTRKLFDGRANYLLPEGTKEEGRAVAQKGLEDEAFNLARQHVAGFDSMPDEQVKAIMPKVMGMLEVMKKTGVADTDWFAGRTAPGTVSPTGALREQSFFQGGRRGSPYTALEGALAPRYEKGDVNFKTAAGHSLRIPNATAEAQAVLDDLIAGRDPFAQKPTAKLGALR